MEHVSTLTKRSRQTVNARPAPVAVLQFGRISAAVFVTTATNKSGKSFDAYSIALRRQYYTAKGRIAYSATLRPADLLPATHALLKCCDLIYKTDAPSRSPQR
jgi:hypothetical protein